MATALASEQLHAIAKQALEHWSLQVTSLTLASQSENTVFRVETADQGTFALRLHRPGYHSLPELESEQIWTRALADGGIAIPKVERTKHGRYYVEAGLGTPTTTRQAGLIQWLPGEALSAVLANQPSDSLLHDTYFALGALIARCHLATLTWTPPIHFTRHAFNHDGFVGDAPFWGRFWELGLTTQSNRDQLTAIRNAVSAHLRSLPKNRQNFGMIHADLHANNVLRNVDQLYVIDFDDAGFGWHAFDLAVAVYDQLDFFHSTPRFDITSKALIAGYDTVRPGCNESFAQLPLFLLVRSLMLLKWIEDRPEVGRENSIPMLLEIAFEQFKNL
jgi:Ser/Thr protein kinase RdoA (MazF antagonist)